MKKYGLIGKSLSHSFSKLYFDQKFEKQSITNASFNLYELTSIEQIIELIQKEKTLEGLSVTIPYKESVIPYLNKKDPTVDRIGACNCIRINNNKLVGYNTDVYGFQKSLKKELKSHHQNALILGNGGASKAVSYALQQMGIEFTILARNPKSEKDIFWGAETTNAIANHSIIINTTPLGTWPNSDEIPPVDLTPLNSKHLVFDLIYNPAKTKFLEEAEKRGASIINGKDMLEFQADQAWRIWNP